MLRFAAFLCLFLEKHMVFARQKNNSSAPLRPTPSFVRSKSVHLRFTTLYTYYSRLFSVGCPLHTVKNGNVSVVLRWMGRSTPLGPSPSVVGASLYVVDRQ